MRIVITEWALGSYNDLRKHFTDQDYRDTIRPDIQRLRDLGTDSRFHDSKFWGPASARPNQTIPDGFKMKWHNMGPSNIQLRLCIGLIGGDAYLCHAYVKSSRKVDQRNCATLMYRLDLIRSGRHEERGEL